MKSFTHTRHWFYLDFLCPQNSQLPTYNFKKFAQELLRVSASVVPLIQLYTSNGSNSLNEAFNQFRQYKTRVPVCGAILLSEDWTECVLVKGWGKNASWTFPKGKINQDEDQRDCALRELLEETGFDASELLAKDSTDYFEHRDNEHRIRLYVVPGVPRNTPFEAQTRKEISQIEWFKLGDLPTAKKPKTPSPKLGGRFYGVSPFMMRLRRWIQANKRTHPKRPTQPEPKEKMTSVNMDAVFGIQKPGLIVLPPAAMRQISNKAKASQSAQSSPPTQPPPPPLNDHDSKKNLLLSLLHGSQPLPAPPPIVNEPRMDGSTALGNLVGVYKSNETSAHSDEKNKQKSLLAILQGSSKPLAEPPAVQPPPTNTPPVPGPWPVSSTSMPRPDEHRNQLLTSLMGSAPLSPMPTAQPSPGLSYPMPPVQGATPVLAVPPSAGPPPTDQQQTLLTLLSPSQPAVPRPGHPPQMPTAPPSLAPSTIQSPPNAGNAVNLLSILNQAPAEKTSPALESQEAKSLLNTLLQGRGA